MDEKTKAKYLAVLSKTVLGVNEDTFRQRVSAEKHEYADWVAKNMQDTQLADQMRGIQGRQDLLVFLLGKMKDFRTIAASQESSVQSTVQTADQPQQATEQPQQTQPQQQAEQPIPTQQQEPQPAPASQPETTPPQAVQPAQAQTQPATTTPATPATPAQEVMPSAPETTAQQVPQEVQQQPSQPTIQPEIQPETTPTPVPETAPQPSQSPQSPPLTQPTPAPQEPQATLPTTTTTPPEQQLEQAVQQPKLETQAPTSEVQQAVQPETQAPTLTAPQEPITPTQPAPEQSQKPVEQTPIQEAVAPATQEITPIKEPEPEKPAAPPAGEEKPAQTKPQDKQEEGKQEEPKQEAPKQEEMKEERRETTGEEQQMDETPEETPEGEPIPFYLRKVEADRQFVLPTGQRLTGILSLAATLPGMQDNTFKAHVTPEKNDFAAWIYHVVHDEKLASSIGPIKGKDEMIRIIESRIRELRGEAEEPTVLPEAPAQQETPDKAETSKAEYETEENIIPTAEKQVEKLPEPETKPEASEIKPEQEPQEKSEEAKLKGEPKEEPKQDKTRETAIQETITNVPEQMSEPQSRSSSTGMTSTGMTQDDILNMPVRDVLTKLGLITSATQFLALEEELEEKKKERPRIMTGVPGFDEMIDGGIPSGTSILVSGGPGSGKTTFCIQMLGAAAERGEKCLFMTFEENEEQLMEHMESYGLDPRKYIESGNLIIQRQDPFKVSRMVEALLAHARGELLIDIDKIIDIIPRGFKPDRVVIDSLSAIAAAFSESSTAYRVYVTQLIKLLERTGATSFLIGEMQGVEKSGHGFVEEFLADGVIIFYNLQKGNIKQSALEILKMRAVNHEKKIVPFEFVPGKGIIVYPLERTFI
ncbi:Flp pilus assembly complex ATPase component TadA [Candidatus Woesearchaeota archaeon]|nr:Flp pilus assembly complex ATPase component TadA [Candidatus Woesearchaeota archaeon]